MHSGTFCTLGAVLPKEFLRYSDNWSEQLNDCEYVTAQILIGSDKAILHPHDVLNESGLPVESDNAWLKRSKLTNKYLVHGHNNAKVHISHEKANVQIGNENN